MYVVGLTGGIGSGKSEAARYFAALGAPVIDTDVIAHLLTAPGMPAVNVIARALGSGVVNARGELDRAGLRQRIFADASARKTLEGILHPMIRVEVGKELARHHAAPYQIVVVPLLFETGGYREVLDATLVVDCSETEQIRRVMARNGMIEQEVRAIMAAQMPREQRAALADDVIVNDGGLSRLAEAVREKHEKYIKTCVVRQSTT